MPELSILGEIEIPTNEFINSGDYIRQPGGKVKKRPHKHSRGNLTSEATSYIKGLPIKDKVDKKNLKVEIEEGLLLHEMENTSPDELITDSWEDWDYKEINNSQELYRVWDTSLPFSENRKLNGIENKSKRSLLYEEKKSELVELQLKVAEKISHIQKLINATPDISVDELMRVVTDGSSEFTSDILEKFRSSFISYSQKHKRVKEYCAISENEPELIYESAFGRKPRGKILIEHGPMTINIVCFDKDDYTAGFYWNQLASNNSQLNEHHHKHALSSGGVAFFGVKDPRLYGIVIMENATDGIRQPEAVKIHEEQHQYNKLFSPVEANLAMKDIILQSLGKNDLTSIQATMKLLNLYYRQERRNLGIDQKARDEFLAYLADGRDPSDILYILINDPLYDYEKMFATQISCIEQALTYEIDQAITENEDLVVNTIDKNLLDPNTLSLLYDEYFSRDVGKNYYNEILSWVDVVYELRKKGYGMDVILPLLYSQPSSFWTKIVKRFPNKNQSVVG